MLVSLGWAHSMVSTRNIAYLLLGYLFCRILYRLIIYPRFLSPLRSIPGPPLRDIFVGQSNTINSPTREDDFRNWVHRYGPIVRIVGPIGMENLLILSPEVLHAVLVKDWLDFPRPNYVRKILGLVAGHGLLTVTGDEHKSMRRAMNPAFSMGNLTAQTDMYYEPIENLVALLQSTCQKGGTVVEMYPWLSKVTLDIICETAFGYSADSLHNPHNELAATYERLLSLQTERNFVLLAGLVSIPGMPALLNSNWISDSWLFNALAPRLVSTLVESTHTIRTISKRILSERMLAMSAIHSSDLSTKKDIMSILIRARHAELVKDGTYSMTDEAMVDQVLTFLGAGHETTASGLSWTLWLLASHPEAQNRLRAEVTPTLTSDPRPDYRTLKDMKWLDCVIMESLRVMPPVPLTTRKAKQDLFVEGHLIPKNTLTIIPIHQVNTWKAVWGEDAEQFRPERWLDLPKAYNPQFSMLSFITGLHGCIGKTMAMIEMKAVLASLVANFVFKPAYDGQVPQPGSAITMKPLDGMPLLVTPILTKQ
ncbi:cytochrome P450 [Cylindrobasidium torrendii FP15055 ss-10]|uniref:Cytochrome P450 n=1 Tax=Cylindrobasidium torrendii FP15055 ss-10 TaxID=1314674 RepID=A0A0D7BCZ6_9AGAR|nr:cytochrome P450 [Cylindrobasidium torrendii FP15055 ss-10]